MPWMNTSRVFGAFGIANVFHAGGEVASGRRENGGLADLAAELVAEPVSLGQLGEAQARDVPSALGQPQVEQVAPTAANCPLGIDLAAQRFVEHYWRGDFLADLGQRRYVLVPHRLLNTGDAERLQGANPLGGFRRRPRLVGVDPQVD